jgi:hypothetical protein
MPKITEVMLDWLNVFRKIGVGINFPKDLALPLGLLQTSRSGKMLRRG